MIKLYSTNCPKCLVLEAKLKGKNLQYTKITDISEMEKLGFASAPILEVDGKTLDFGGAIRWVKNL